MKRMQSIIKIVVFGLIVLSLGACVLQPREEQTGSIEISIPASSPSLSAVSPASTDGEDLTPTHARVILYQNGEQMRQTMVNLENTSRRVRFQAVPEGDGYTLVVIWAKAETIPAENAGDNDDAENGEEGVEIMLPSAYAQSDSFSVVAGRDATVSMVQSNITDSVKSLVYPAELRGKDISSVVRVGADVFSAVPDPDGGAGRIYGYTDGEVSFEEESPARLFSVSTGRISADNDRALFVNTARGIYRRTAGGAYLRLPGTPSDARNIVDSGSFFIDAESDEGVFEDSIVVYYSRHQGFGGVSTPSLSEPDQDRWQWGDSEDGLNDLVRSGESPIRTMATDGESAAYIASTIGTFKMTREFIDDPDVDIASLLGGDDDETQGFTFFGVAYPGSSRPMRISHIGIIPRAVAGQPNRIVVGTGRGAFWFNGTAVDDLTSTGLIRSENVNRINTTGVRDRTVTGISLGESRIAVATRSQITVFQQSDFSSATPSPRPLIQIPTRAVTLGEMRKMYLHPSGWLYIASEHGLTAIELPDSD